jgi:hypothetical protein
MGRMKYLFTVSILVAVAMLYGGGYCLMLKGRLVTYKENYTTGPEQPHYHVVGPDVLSYDHIASKIVTAFFVPANIIDKCMRPGEWTGPQAWNNLPERPINPADISPNPM